MAARQVASRHKTEASSRFSSPFRRRLARIPAFRLRIEMRYGDAPMSEHFERLSNEYAQAVQALEAIEAQASTLLLLGSSGDLRRFIDQFLAMAARAKASAQDAGEEHFVEWFNELIEKAEAIRAGAAGR
jgi:hypothetical protein